MPAGEGRGHGIAYARYKNTGAYCVVVVPLRVDERIRLEHIWIAADLGLLVHRDGAQPARGWGQSGERATDGQGRHARLFDGRV